MQNEPRSTGRAGHWCYHPGGRGYPPAKVFRSPVRPPRSPRRSGSWVSCGRFDGWRWRWDAQYGLRPFGHPPYGGGWPGSLSRVLVNASGPGQVRRPPLADPRPSRGTKGSHRPRHTTKSHERFAPWGARPRWVLRTPVPTLTAPAWGLGGLRALRRATLGAGCAARSRPTWASTSSHHREGAWSPVPGARG